MFIKILYYILTCISLFYTLYFTLTGLWTFKKNKTVIKEFDDETKFAIVVAARNESNVIGYLVKSLFNQNYDNNLYDVYVLPNNCTDNTAEVAKENGADVIEVTLPVKSKGDVLKFAFDELKDTGYDAYLIFDADNVVHPDFLKYMNNVYQSGYNASQGRKDSKNMYDNWISCGYSLFYSIQNIFYNKARTNVGMSATINGTGFMIAKEFIEKHGFNPVTLTEDIELSIMCILNGEKVVYCDDAITYDEQPTGFGTSIHQRKRWSLGIIQCSRIYNRQLFRRAWKYNDKSAMDKILFNIAPYTQILSLIPFILLALMNMSSLAKVAWAVVVYDYSGIVMGYVLSVAISIYAIQYYGRSVFKSLWGIILFVIFILSWIPVNIACMFIKKEVNWSPIEHCRDVDISDLIK